MAEFQRLKPDQSRADARSASQRVAIEADLADVLINLVRLADTMGVDLSDAAARKLRTNAEMYRSDEVRGIAEKRP